MRHILPIVAITLLATFTLTACGTGNNDTQNSDQQGITNEDNTANQTDKNTNATDDRAANNDNNTDTAVNTDQDDMLQQMDKLDYEEFELEVKYAGDQDYEAKIDYDDGRLDADLDDDFANIDIDGKEAFDKIYPIVESLTIDQNTTKEDAIDEVLEAFDLKADYEKIELEIKFKDGAKIEFKD